MTATGRRSYAASPFNAGLDAEDIGHIDAIFRSKLDYADVAKRKKESSFRIYSSILQL